MTDNPRTIATPNTNEAWSELGSDDEKLLTDGGENDNPYCPNECGEQLEDLIDYVRGHKTSNGYRCPVCHEEWMWDEWEEAKKERVPVGVVAFDGKEPNRRGDRVEVYLSPDEGYGLHGASVLCVEGKGEGKVTVEEDEDGTKKAFLYVDA